MCWQDGCGAERPKAAEQQATGPSHLSLIKTIPLKGRTAHFFWLVNSSNPINLCVLWHWKHFHLFNFLLSVVAIVAAAKKEMCYSSSSPPLYCMFLPASSDWILLKDYKDVFFFFFCFVLQFAAGGTAMLYCCWQWSGPMPSPHKMLEFNSFSRLDGGLTFL